MPPRRRSNKRRERIDPEAFLWSDGVKPFFTGDQCWETPFLARAAWEQVRSDTWRHELRDLWPPAGSVAYDGITERTYKLRPLEASWSLEATREAIDADIASVGAFRREEPAKAASIADELEAYVEDLRVLLHLAEKLGEERDELGKRRALSDSWRNYLMRRRGHS